MRMRSYNLTGVAPPFAMQFQLTCVMGCTREHLSEHPCAHQPAEYCSRGSLTDIIRAAKARPEVAAELTWERRLAMVRHLLVAVDSNKPHAAGVRLWQMRANACREAPLPAIRRRLMPAMGCCTCTCKTRPSCTVI